LIFTLEAQSGGARAATIEIATDHSGAKSGETYIQTPVFMPVGTAGAVKSLDAIDLNTILKPQIILANTYHLYLRPGAAAIKEAGGLRRWTRFGGLFLTDSGGFQAFSLRGAKVTDEGVKFRSHIDGSPHFFTPRGAIEAQQAFGSDIMMTLDDLPALPAKPRRIKESIERTTRWARESLEFHNRSLENGANANANLFAIAQGGVDRNFREISAGELTTISANGKTFDGFAIGGLSVGEENAQMYETIDFTAPLLPAEKPRYLMGVGAPENLVEAVDRGVDMFDCVMPTRNARNGTLFTRRGAIHIRRAEFDNCERPVEEGCECYACQNFSIGYIRHLYKANEITYYRLASLHNLHYYLELTRRMRSAILADRWAEFKREFYADRGK
jgi:queuine tRNA-ribosyltransferase